MTKNERVRELQKELGLSQAAFGEKLKVSQRAIGHIQSGANSLSSRNFDNICQIFNVNPKWLESREYPMFVPSPDKDFFD